MNKFYGRIVGRTKCRRCGRVIAVTRQIETPNGCEYVKENLPHRYTDRWGFERNFCKGCMR